MARLVYSTLASVDGYVADEDGDFGWAAPDEEVHAVVNELERPIGTYLYGRRMYEVMVAWETLEVPDGGSAAMRDYAEIWRAADKVVYSTTLGDASSARTTVERTFDPQAVRRLKNAADRDLSVGGPHLAAHALRAGLVDECHFFVVPYVAGGGTRSLPDDLRLALTLVSERRFGNGTVHLNYRLDREGPFAQERVGSGRGEPLAAGLGERQDDAHLR